MRMLTPALRSSPSTRSRNSSSVGLRSKHGNSKNPRHAKPHHRQSARMAEVQHYIWGPVGVDGMCSTKPKTPPHNTVVQSNKTSNTRQQAPQTPTPPTHTTVHHKLSHTPTYNKRQLTHPLQVLEAGAAARHDAKLEGRPHRVQGILVTQLLVFQLCLSRRANLTRRSPGTTNKPAMATKQAPPP